MQQRALKHIDGVTGDDGDRTSLEPIHDYYCSPRSTGGSQLQSIYEIWEAGGAFNDSVTPSTYCAEYRSHMVLKIASLLGERGRVFSIGCGNGFVEADLVSRGIAVEAIDCNDEAVVLAASKGVGAFRADYFSLPPSSLSDFDVVYADGLLGHVYHSEMQLEPFFEALSRLRPRPGSWLVFSNDAPLLPEVEVMPHARVSGFWLLSRRYLERTLQRLGFEPSESYHFPYVRPVSGLRNRTICIARVAGQPSA